MCIGYRFWSKFWLIKVQELKVDKKKEFKEIGSPSLTPHSLKYSSTTSHQLRVLGPYTASVTPYCY